MPKQVPLIPDELVLRELDSLAPSICVTASQAAMVLGISVPQLEERRRAGTPPPFVSDEVRGKVRYTVGALRDHVRSHTHQNTRAARAASDARASGMAFSTFADFLALGEPDDLWPFMMGEHGRPIDLLRSLGLELDAEGEGTWLSAEEYAARLSRAVAKERSARQADLLDDLLPQGHEVLCACGKPRNPEHGCGRI